MDAMQLGYRFNFFAADYGWPRQCLAWSNDLMQKADVEAVNSSRTDGLTFIEKLSWLWPNE
jgi:hypothetical protein